MEDLSPRGPNEAEVQLKEELEKMEKELQSKVSEVMVMSKVREVMVVGKISEVMMHGQS